MKTKLVRITTVPISLHKLIKGQPVFMQKNGFEVYLVSASGIETECIWKETGIKVELFPYTRKISPLTDLKALWLTYRYFRRIKPDIVHTHTPKAGIVGMLAAKLAGVPIRMHTVAGLPLMEANGLNRKILNAVEKLTSWSSTTVYPNSRALKVFMEKEGLAKSSKLKVIGNGSSNGIDTEFFSKGAKYLEVNRGEIGLESTNIVFCFVGRIVGDKGINELLSAFDKLSKINENIKLVLVGPEEKELDPVHPNSQVILQTNKQVITVGWQEDVRPYLALSDVFVFPSYREGFPNAVMQAGAMDLPCIVTDINGCNEIIEDGYNGAIIPVKDEKALFDRMKLLVNDLALRKKLAKAARQLIVDKYEQKFVWKELLKEYIKLLNEEGIGHSISTTL